MIHDQKSHICEEGGPHYGISVWKFRKTTIYLKNC